MIPGGWNARGIRDEPLSMEPRERVPAQQQGQGRVRAQIQVQVQVQVQVAVDPSRPETLDPDQEPGLYLAPSRQGPLSVPEAQLEAVRPDWMEMAH